MSETRDESGRFKPGVSGNPAGRPRTSAMALWRRLNAEVDPEDDAETKRTRLEKLYHRLYGAAMGGSIQAAALILDRAEGKARQTVTLTVEKREQLEALILGVMEEAGCTRDEAIRALEPQVRACVRAGIVDLRFHDLRHEYGSRLGDADVNLKKIARLMGHSNTKQTERYVHPTDDGLLQATTVAERSESSRNVPRRLREVC